MNCYSSRLCLALLAVGSWAPGAAWATDYVNDPLTGPGAAGLGVRGGSFSANGWTTSAATDTV